MPSETMKAAVTLERGTLKNDTLSEAEFLVTRSRRLVVRSLGYELREFCGNGSRIVAWDLPVD
jgi:hypothetical protein